MDTFAQFFQTIPARYPELTGRTAVVTGSGRGIGRGIALRLAREGARVVITSNVAAEVEATAAELRGLGLPVLAVTADLSQAGEVERLMEAAQTEFGPVRLLVNNAADLRRVRFLEHGLDLLDSQIDINVKAAYRAAYCAAQQMRAAGVDGSIIQVSSVGGLRAHWRGLPYDMTKGAIDAFTRAQAIDLAEYGIRVNAIAPGFTRRTLPCDPANDSKHYPAYIRRIPVQRAGTPLDMAAAVAFLASDDAAYILGQVLYVDGGITAQLSPQEAEL
jgi:NAD(P)-dependent dehydrogenase (short-subunit alcohol dehydrogenase family)